jgi:hypothetical protein
LGCGPQQAPPEPEPEHHQCDTGREYQAEWDE